MCPKPKDSDSKTSAPRSKADDSPPAPWAGPRGPELTPGRCEQLDVLLTTDADLGVARLVWLNYGPISASAESVKAEVAKLGYLEGLGAHRLDLSAVPPERLRQLATVARLSTPRAGVLKRSRRPGIE